MSPARPQLLRWLLPWIAACAGGLLLGRPAAAQSVWELTPYRIHVLLALGTAPELTPRLQADLTADLAARVDSLVGPGWDVTLVAAPPRLQHALATQIDAVTVESLAKESLTYDKVMLLAVVPDPSGYRVIARELDVRTRIWSTTAHVPAGQAAKLRDAAFRALHMGFAPLARVETVEKRAVTLRLRAAALPPRDKALAWVAPGDVFQPLLRRNDREGNLRGVVAVPWTFLAVEEVARAELKCRLHTGIAGPLSGRRRGRIEQLALAVIPPGKPTRLVLQSRTEPRQALVGYEIYVQSPDNKPPDFLGRSDWQGSLMIQPTGQPLRVLLVKHGGELLARLPVVPGLRAEAVALVPNDDQRLEAEQAITEFQEMLVDQVTRRELLLTKARAALAAKKFDQVEALIGELHLLETPEQLHRKLQQQQERIVSGDAAIQRRIDTLFSDTRKLLEKHVKAETIEQLRAQLAAARSNAEKGG